MTENQETKVSGAFAWLSFLVSLSLFFQCETCDRVDRMSSRIYELDKQITVIEHSVTHNGGIPPRESERVK